MDHNKLFNFILCSILINCKQDRYVDYNNVPSDANNHGAVRRLYTLVSWGERQRGSRDQREDEVSIVQYVLGMCHLLKLFVMIRVWHPQQMPLYVKKQLNVKNINAKFEN